MKVTRVLLLASLIGACLGFIGCKPKPSRGTILRRRIIKKRIARKRCASNRRSLRPRPPPLYPLTPIAGFYGVVCAPVYGKGLPLLGGAVDFETLAPRVSPNEFLSAPASDCLGFINTEKRAFSRDYPLSPEALRDEFLRVVEARYSIKEFARPTVSNDATLQYTFVERTLYLRFPDIINVRFAVSSPSPELGPGPSSTLYLHSGSIYGWSDLGKNRERVEEILAELGRRVPQGALPAADGGSLAIVAPEAAETLDSDDDADDFIPSD